MNRKLKTALILMRNSKEQGFAVAIALVIGLVMLLVGTTMIVRSQGDKTNGTLQKSTSKSLSVAEAGVTRIQQFLNNNRLFATVNYPWSNYVTNTTTGLGCSTSLSLYVQAHALDDWQQIGSSDDRFKVISYTYNVTNPATNTGQGTLVVEGQSRQGTTVTSTARLQVNIPVQRKIIPSFTPPGVWANSYSLGNNKFQSDVVIDTGCTSSITSSQESNFSPVTAATVKFIRDPSLTLPGPLPVPTQCPSPASFTIANKPCAIYLSAPLTSSTTFPRPIDIVASTLNGYGTTGTGTNGEYIYYIPKGSDTNSVNIKGNDVITITSGQKVTLYLEGNLNSGGSSEFKHDCSTTTLPCSPTDLQIFGGQNTTQILIRGNSTIDAFVFAPNASNSGIDGTGQLRGSMWIKGWNASSANHVMVTQTGKWNNLPQFLQPPNIDTTASWQRQETQ